MPVEFSIIIVNWNTGELLADCLRSIEQSTQMTGVEVIVVDNASNDDSCRLMVAFPWLTLIQNRENVGFSRANNQGIVRSQGRYVLLLNPDTILLNDVVAELKSVFEQDASIGIIGARLVTPDYRLQRWARGKMLSLRTGFNHYLFLSALFPNSRVMAGLVDNRDHQSLTDMDWVSGACLAVRRTVLDDVGFLDESIFMYNEDMELCYRVKQAGYRVVYAPAARVKHFVGQSFKKQKVNTVLAAPLQSQDIFYQRLYGQKGLFLFRSVVCLGTLLRFILRLTAFLWHSEDQRRHKMLEARRNAAVALKLFVFSRSEASSSDR